MYVSNATTATLDTTFTSQLADRSAPGLIEGSAANDASAGLAADIGKIQPFANVDSQASHLVSGKAPGQVVDLTPELASNAIDDALLSMDVFKDSGAPEGFTRLSEAELTARVGAEVTLNDEQTGFAAAVYRNDDTGHITVAFRGSEAGNWQEFQSDWLKSDIGQAFFNVPESYKQASALAGQINAAFSGEASVSLTGMSLGGGMANYAAIDNNMDYTIFNAAGLARHTVDSLGDKVSNYTGHGTVINDQYDPLTNLGGKNNDETWGNQAKHIGYDELVFVENDSFRNFWDNFNVQKRTDAHNLKNIIPTLQNLSMMA